MARCLIPLNPQGLNHLLPHRRALERDLVGLAIFWAEKRSFEKALMDPVEGALEAGDWSTYWLSLEPWQVFVNVLYGTLSIATLADFWTGVPGPDFSAGETGVEFWTTKTGSDFWTGASGVGFCTKEVEPSCPDWAPARDCLFSAGEATWEEGLSGF